jgi:ATP-dependent Clp protease adapter protein ClpS
MPTEPRERTDQESDVLVQEPAKVILFNDDVHSIDEVVAQVMKALRCTQAKAEAIALEAHHLGRALVYTGELLRCVEISNVLEEIRLLTQIEV